MVQFEIPCSLIAGNVQVDLITPVWGPALGAQFPPVRFPRCYLTGQVLVVTGCAFQASGRQRLGKYLSSSSPLQPYSLSSPARLIHPITDKSSPARLNPPRPALQSTLLPAPTSYRQITDKSTFIICGSRAANQPSSRGATQAGREVGCAAGYSRASWASGWNNPYRRTPSTFSGPPAFHC